MFKSYSVLVFLNVLCSLGWIWFLIIFFFEPLNTFNSKHIIIDKEFTSLDNFCNSFHASRVFTRSVNPIKYCIFDWNTKNPFLFRFLGVLNLIERHTTPNLFSFYVAIIYYTTTVLYDCFVGRYLPFTTTML